MQISNIGHDLVIVQYVAMLFDTHSHIQFPIFDATRDNVLNRAKKAGVEKIIAVGTDLESSLAAVKIAQNSSQIFASVGIHPHHLFEKRNYQKDLSKLTGLITHKKVVAVGETGMDKYLYKETKYKYYTISKDFLHLQKEIFSKQIKLAIKHKKTLIIHNRESVKETLEVLEKNWDKVLENKLVFHLCEPSEALLEFAQKHHIFISFSGDITTDKTKQEFIKMIPLDLLVLETDSPFISKEPADIKKILDFISKILKINKEELAEIIFKNSQKLFNFS